MALFGLRGKNVAPNVTVVTTMKDEAPYIIDWVAHYRSLGATEIVVFTNDCTDQTDHILRSLNAKGHVQHRFSRVMRRGPHKSALMWADYEPAVLNADWVLVVDVDEYLDIRVGDGTFADLIAANPNADAISFPWRIFGNAGVHEIDKTPVPCSFTLAQTKTGRENEARFFKTLYRQNGKFARLGVHRPFLAAEPEDINWVLADGHPLTTEQKKGGVHIRDHYGYDAAQLNHYALRSVEGFLNKQKRGRANHFKASIDLGYWRKFNKNDETDMSLAEKFQGARDLRDQMLADDPKLAKHFDAAIEWHRKAATTGNRDRQTRRFLRFVTPDEKPSDAA